MYDEIENDLNKKFNSTQKAILVTILAGKIVMGANAMISNFSGSQPDTYECLDAACQVGDFSLEEHCAGCVISPQNASTKTGTASQCQSGFKYHYPVGVYNQTIIQDFDLVCDRQILVQTATSSYFFGLMLGCFIAGPINNFLGRRFSILISCFMMFFFGICAGLSQSITYYMLSRFFIGVGFNFYVISGFNYVMEFVNSNNRTILNLFWGITFSIGVSLLAPLAVYLKSWRHLQIGVSFLIFPVLIILLFILPESWKFLMGNNRIEECMQVIQKFADPQDVSKIEQNIKILCRNNFKQQEVIQPSFVQNAAKLFKYQDLNLVTFSLALCWFANNAVYYGIGLNLGQIPGSQIVNMLIMGLVDIPGYYAMSLVMNHPKAGRVPFQKWGLMLAGISCILATYLHEFNFDSTSRILAFLGRMISAGTFQSTMQITSEFYPTEMRATAYSILMMIGRSAGFLVPYILATATVFENLPNIIFGLVGILAGISSFLVPETRGQPLLLTLEEAKHKYGKKW